MAHYDPLVDGPVTEFCRLVGISRASFYRLRRRFDSGGEAALEASSRAPVHHPNQVGEAVVEQILALRAELVAQGLDAGGVTIAYHLRQRATPECPAPSSATVNRVLARAGAVTRNRRKKPRTAWRRFERRRVNELWQIDAICLTGMPGRWAIYQIIDDASRLCVGLRAFPRPECPADAITALDEAIAAHGLPRQVLSDNGSAFNTHRRGLVSDTEAHLASLGVLPISGMPGRPTTQGKNERSHQGVESWLDAHPTTGLDALNRALDDYRHVYNTIRPHSRVGEVPPAQAAAALELDDAPRTPYDPADLLGPARRGTIHVRHGGVADYQGVTLYLGVERAGTTVTAIHRPAAALTLTDPDDRIITTITWPPQTRYLNLTPRGPRHFREPRH